MVFGNTNVGIRNKQLPQNEEVDCDTINEESNTQLGQNDPVDCDTIDEESITIGNLSVSKRVLHSIHG